jgi:PTH1 family peptidyl-tRNA hydrolase
MADGLVVGLGNPGEEYAHSRHNLGADVVAELAARRGSRLKLAKRDRSLVADVTIAGRAVTLAFPQTYVNDSGEAVRLLARHHDVTDPHDIVVVHDELDLPSGRMKVKDGGGLAGHNGLRSIKHHLHTDGFVRVRIGVGKPPSKEQGANHVLRRISKKERAELDVVVQLAADAVEMIVADGVPAAMTRFNA